MALLPRLAPLLILVLVMPAGAHSIGQVADVPDHATGMPEAAPTQAGYTVREAPVPEVLMAPRGIEFVCPAGGQVLGQPVPTTEGGDVTVHGCPIRVYDATYSFGNPQLAVNANDHREIAFFSLHSAPARNGPNDYSRSAAITHTTFTSRDQGLSWSDQPTDTGRPGSGAMGETAEGTMDSYGNMYAAFLWSREAGDAFDYVIRTFKGPTTQQESGMQQAYTDPETFDTRTIGNTISEVNLLQLPTYVPPLEDDNRTYAPTTEEENGETAEGDIANATEERIVLTYHEAARDWRNSTTGMSAWINVYWTDVSARNHWTGLEDDQLIGPCRTASNPVHHEDKVYIACVVDRGYEARPRARVGEIDIWEVDVFTGNTSFVAQTGLVGGRVMMAATEDGYMVTLNQRKVLNDQGNMTQLAVGTAFGWYGKSWTRTMIDIGPELRRMGQAQNEKPLLDADITALEITDEERTSLLVYKEYHDDPTDINSEEPDPGAPMEFVGDTLTDYNKYLISFNACEPMIAAAKLELGTAVDAYNAQSYQENAAVFNDIQDGLMAVTEPNGGEIVYFAVNDYGAMQVGGVQAFSVSEVCGIQFPPLQVPPVGLPATLSVVSPAASALAAVIAIPAVAAVGYLLLAKRRVAHFVTAEDE